MGLFLSLYFFIRITLPGARSSVGLWASMSPLHSPSHHSSPLILLAPSEAGAAEEGTPHSLLGRCHLPKVTALGEAEPLRVGRLRHLSQVQGSGRSYRSLIHAHDHGRLIHKEGAGMPSSPRGDSQLLSLPMMCHQVSITIGLFICRTGQMKNIFQECCWRSSQPTVQ